MEVISPSFATVVTPQTTELRELIAKVTRLKRQISNLQATGRCRSSNRRTRSHSPLLHTSMQQAGKRWSQQLGATSTAGPTQSCLFCETDHASGLKFLIDTSAEVIEVPRSHTHRKTQNGPSLQAINNTSFPTYDACSH